MFAMMMVCLLFIVYEQYRAIKRKNKAILEYTVACDTILDHWQDCTKLLNAEHDRASLLFLENEKLKQKLGKTYGRVNSNIKEGKGTLKQ